MLESSGEPKLTQHVEDLNILIPSKFPLEKFRTAVNYKPRPDDVFIVTYPKCGTTWAQQILLLIFRQGKPLDTFKDLYRYSPFMEVQGAQAAEMMIRPGPIKYHLPYHLCPKSDQAKYIYVTRNPKDCCVSYFHHEKRRWFDASFDVYFELFISGDVAFGDYFDHLLGWYAHRNDKNVLFVTYEEMKEDLEAAVLKMASFIDDEKYAEPLRKDRQKLDNVIKYSSFESMKEAANKSAEGDSDESEAKTEQLSDTSKTSTSKGKMRRAHLAMNVRKGIIGDWKSYFSESQNKRLDEKFAERTKGTDIPEFWKKYMS